MGFITRHGYLRSVDRPAMTSVRDMPGNFEQEYPSRVPASVVTVT
jgi:hypothetical protein